MQALSSTWRIKCDLLIVRNLGSEQSSCLEENFRSNIRKSVWDIGFPVCHGKNSGFLLGASNSIAVSRWSFHRKPKLELGYGFLSGFSRFKGARFCKRRKVFFSPSFTTALAFEQQAIRSEFRMEELNSDGSLLEQSKSNSDIHFGGVETKQEGEDIELGNEDSNVVENSGKIDVRELALSLRFAKTADDVDEILKDKGDFPLQVYSTVIKGLGKDKLLDPAFAIVEWIKRKKEETNGMIVPNLFIYNSLLGAVKHSERFGELDRVLDDMASESVSPNVVTYNSIMAIYVEQGESEKAIGVLEEIRKKGLIPSPVSYSTTMSAYRKMEDAFGAVKFFIEAREKYQKGEIGKDDGKDWKTEFVRLENYTIRVCYQVMRQWLVKEEDLSTNVLKVLIAMDNAGISPGRSEHERLLWACTREEHALVAKELYDRIRETHSEISLSVCNHMIWLMGKARKWWLALEIYEDLLDKGPQPNNMSHEIIVSHFNVLLSAARKRGIWKWGIRLLNKMEEKGLKPRSKEWNSVLIACSKASETSAAVKIFKRMVEQGQKPTLLSYGALLSALEKGKLYDEARKVWEHMLKVGIEPNVYAYTTMASVFAGQGKFNLVETILNDMVSSGVKPTVVTYNAIISGCVRNDNSNAAFEWFHRMKFVNVTPNNVTYEMLIEALGKDGKPRLAYELYLRARNEGLELAGKAYDAVIEASEIHGATIDLRLLGPRSPETKGSSVQPLVGEEITPKD